MPNKDPNASVIKGLPTRITGRRMNQRPKASTAAPSAKRRPAPRPNPLAKATARPVTGRSGPPRMR